jgi:hypothetical protein
MVGQWAWSRERCDEVYRQENGEEEYSEFDNSFSIPLSNLILIVLGAYAEGGLEAALEVVGYEHAFVHSIADFLAAVAGQSTYRPHFRDGARVLEILDAARKADESSASVKLVPTAQG